MGSAAATTASFMADVDTLALESKLQLLTLQRELSAVRCQHFLDELENKRSPSHSRPAAAAAAATGAQGAGGAGAGCTKLLRLRPLPLPSYYSLDDSADVSTWSRTASLRLACLPTSLSLDSAADTGGHGRSRRGASRRASQLSAHAATCSMESSKAQRHSSQG